MVPFMIREKRKRKAKEAGKKKSAKNLKMRILNQMTKI